VIRLKDVTARSAPYRISNVSLDVGAGVRSILGRPADGAPLLLAVLAGWVRPRSGEALVLGGSPEAKRRQIAYVPLDVRLPPSLRVSETLELAASVRGESAAAPPRARLEVLGIAPLAERWTDSLTPAETRAVALAEAITSSARVLLLDEPLVDLDPRSRAGVAGSLRDRARGGASIVIGTSSPRDALDLSDEQWVLDRGRIAATTRATDTSMLSASPKPRLRVLAQGARQGARALLGALASEPHFVEIETDGDALLLSGTDAAAMAESVSRAALAAGVELEVLCLEAPSLDQLRANALRRTSPRAGAGAP
jgi:NitT/TauT family transport system ATP-binding protein